LLSQCPKKAEQRILLLFGLDIIEDRIGPVGFLRACGEADLLQQKRLDQQVIFFGPAVERDSTPRGCK
jgi:hypothetical protein